MDSVSVFSSWCKSQLSILCGFFEAAERWAKPQAGGGNLVRWALDLDVKTRAEGTKGMVFVIR
jgi:hypothetical protein